MKKDFIADYLAYILIRLFGPAIRSLPLNVSLSLGRTIGELLYYFDSKHRRIAYVNIKTAFGALTLLSTNGERSRTIGALTLLSTNGERSRTIGAKLSASGILRLARESYRSFGQNLIEVLLIPLMDKAYLDKYITLEGRQHIDEGFHKGKGVIFLAVHAGSWELSNVICANLGFPFNLFIRQQRYPRLNRLLNLYRKQQGCRIIQREKQLRDLIRVLKNNEAVGMMADQGGRAGTLVNFFGKGASMASGAVRFVLKYDAAIIPVFYTRIKGPYVKVFIEPPFEIKKTGNLEEDIRNNLQRLVNLFERYILQHPQEYLWYYKIWKYSKERNILILSDGKAGHLAQSEALVKILKGFLGDNGISANIETVEVKFRNNALRHFSTINICLTGKYRFGGYVLKPDFVISCGSLAAPVNYAIAKENLAKSIVIMRPSILSTRRFDLVIMSKHDNPARRKNILVTEGALNLIDEEYLKEQANKLLQLSPPLPKADPPPAEKAGPPTAEDFCIGLLIGGNTKKFRLREEVILELIKQIKSVSEKCNADILITTSRRTPREIELLLKKEFGDYPPCKLLIIANEKNIPQAMAGILSLSKAAVVSPESISMISEAVNSKKYVFVFDVPGLDRKHRRFLDYFAENKYIHLSGANDLGRKIEEAWLNRPEVHILKDNLLVAEAIEKIL